jgi:hypothetical protein
MHKKKQSKTVNKEAFRMLAVEIGLNEACRKLDVPIPTGKSWARRGRLEAAETPRGQTRTHVERIQRVQFASHSGCTRCDTQGA